MNFCFPRDDNFTNCEHHWNTLGCHQHFSLSRVDSEQFQTLQEKTATEGIYVSSILIHYMYFLYILVPKLGKCFDVFLERERLPLKFFS